MRIKITQVLFCVFSIAFSPYFMKKIDSYIYDVLLQMYTALCSAQCKFFMEDTLQHSISIFNLNSALENHAQTWDVIEITELTNEWKKILNFSTINLVTETEESDIQNFVVCGRHLICANLLLLNIILFFMIECHDD